MTAQVQHGALTLIGPDGKTPIPARGTEEGYMIISGGTGGGVGGDASAALQADQIVLEAAIRDRLPATAHAQPLTNDELRLTPVPVSGTVAVTGVATETSAAAIATAAGTPADSAWSGTGDSTLVAALKAIWTKLGTLLSVSPSMSSGVHVSAQTAATGSNWTAFGSQACKQLTVHNNTGTVIEVSVGGTGVGIPIQTGMFYTFFGLTNASALSIRRVDQSNTQVTVQARAES